VRPKPSKPLFFYLVPLLRIKNILSEIEPTVSKGDPVALRATVNTIVGSPWNAKENLKQAALCLDSDKDYQVANAIATEFVEYMSQVDYSKYFDSVTTSVNERQLIFSLQSARVCTRDQISGGPLLVLVAKPPVFPHTHTAFRLQPPVGKAANFPKTTTRTR